MLGGLDLIYKYEGGLHDHSPCGCGSLNIQNPSPGLYFYYFPNIFPYAFERPRVNIFLKAL